MDGINRCGLMTLGGRELASSGADECCASPLLGVSGRLDGTPLGASRLIIVSAPSESTLAGRWKEVDVRSRCVSSMDTGMPLSSMLVRRG